MSPVPLALQIRQARVRAGMTRGALERALGMLGSGAVSRYESGQRTPTVDILSRIAVATGAVFVIEGNDADTP